MYCGCISNSPQHALPGDPTPPSAFCPLDLSRFSTPPPLQVLSSPPSSTSAPPLTYLPAPLSPPFPPHPLTPSTLHHPLNSSSPSHPLVTPSYHPITPHHPRHPLITPLTPLPGIIVDPSFRDCFRIAPATPGYQRLVAALPEAFVGDACALRRLVALITAQASRSYEFQGLTPPPWRRYSAMIARWLPPRGSGAAGRYRDTPVSPPSSPLKRLGSEEAAALAVETAREAARGALARLAAAVPAAVPAVRVRGAVAAAAPPARVVRGFDLGNAGEAARFVTVP